jgi:hypothetical protein
MTYTNTEPTIWYATAAHNPDWLLAELRAGQTRLLLQLCDERGKDTPSLQAKVSTLEGKLLAVRAAALAAAAAWEARRCSALLWANCIDLPNDDALEHVIGILRGTEQP